tara:strand:+ start:178 stop:423 length:246 start_codon:yes stop_codon:yes gene_type:complete
MVAEVTNSEPVLVLGDKKYIISELSDEAQYCISQINDIQKDINVCTIALDRHRTAYSGFQLRLERAVQPPEIEETVGAENE